MTSLNYADCSTPYNADKNMEFSFNNLEHLSSSLFKWLNDIYVETNTGKIHILLSGNLKATAKIDSNYIESENKQGLLDITINSNLTFENHINNICTEQVKN